MTIDERAKKFGHPGTSNPMYGKTHTFEVRKSISLKRLGKSPSNKGKTLSEIVGEERAYEIKKTLSEKAKLITGNKNPFFNKSHSNKTKKILSQKMKGKKPVNMKKVIINDVIYESVTDAARKLSVSPATIIYRIKSNNIIFSSYKYL